MDETLAIAQLKAGNIAGLQTLVEKYQVEAVQAAGIITGDRTLAEDIVQAAFLRAFEKIRGFDETRPFRPWFMRMVTNDAIKAAVRQHRQRPLPEDGDADYEMVLQQLSAQPRESEDALVREERIAGMRQAIRRLSPTQRAAIVMVYFLNMSTEDSADQLNCAPGTLRWHLSAARARLKMLLASQEGNKERI